MKRLVYIITIFAFIITVSCPVFAETKVDKSLDIKEAMEQGITNNRQMAIDDLSIKVKESAIKQAIKNADMTGDSYGAERVLQSRINKEVKVMEAKTALEAAKMVKNDNIKKLKLDIYKTFQNILLKQIELNTEKQKLDIMKERVNIAESRYKAKSITKEDLDEAQYNLYSKTLDVERLTEELANLDMELKGHLNLPFDTDLLIIKGTIAIEEYQEINIDKVVAERIDSDTDVFSASGKYEAAKRTMEITAELLKEGNEIYNNNKFNFDSALRGYETAKRNREVNIRNIYNDLLNKKDTIELSTKYEELMKKRLENAQTKYNSGQINKETYLAQKERYLDAEISKIRAISDFNKKKAEFDVITQD